MSEVDLTKPGHARRRRRATPPRRSSASPPASTACSSASRTSAASPGRAVVRAQEQERARIAQDLHDEVNQALTAIKLRLRRRCSDAPPRLVAELQETKQLVDRGDGGAAAHRPRAAPDRARRPRPDPRARHRRSPTSASAPASARASAATASCRMLSDEEQLVIYRVTQESLSNIVQHAGAKQRRRRALLRRARRVLRVADDGSGFDAAPTATATRPQRRPRPLRHARARAARRRQPRPSSPRPARAPPSN